jgi:hypothetical protein
MRNRTSQTLALVSAAVLAATVHAAGDDCPCVHCGCSVGCQKVCRLVCEEKKVDVVCWGCLCEDFCVPKHSKPGCLHSKPVCTDCKVCLEDCTKSFHAEPKRFLWTDWCPSCAKIFTRKKLMKKIETVTVPSYKWKVECLCPRCEATCAAAEIASANDLPPPPIAAARLVYRVRAAAPKTHEKGGNSGG